MPRRRRSRITFSQRFYPVRYESGRLARVVVSAIVACAAGRAAVPVCRDHLLGVFVRGTTVVVVMAGALWLGGFLRPENCACSSAYAGTRTRRGPVAPSGDTTEFAGEIVVDGLARRGRRQPSRGARHDREDADAVTTPSRTSLAVGAVCLLGFGLRVIGLQYGLPAVYNPDEVAIMARALSFARGTLNPHNFLYPTFYFYVAVRVGRPVSGAVSG